MASLRVKATKDKFPVGSTVVDRETGEVGTVVWHFSDPTIKSVVVVRWFGRCEGVAEPVDALRLWKAQPGQRPA